MQSNVKLLSNLLTIRYLVRALSLGTQLLQFNSIRNTTKHESTVNTASLQTLNYQTTAVGHSTSAPAGRPTDGQHAPICRGRRHAAANSRCRGFATAGVGPRWRRDGNNQN